MSALICVFIQEGFDLALILTKRLIFEELSIDANLLEAKWLVGGGASFSPVIKGIEVSFDVC